MKEVFICDAIRTPIGRYGGSLSLVRADDLCAVPLKALMDRNPDMDWNAIDDIVIGCANQAGEDNRNVARMALLLAGFSETISGSTVNRLCGSGLDAIGTAARAIKSGETEIMIAGGVESMSRAPFVTGKSTQAFSRESKTYDTTIGWRFVNEKLNKMYGTEGMIQTAQNIATDFNISREDQDAFAQRSQEKADKAKKNGNLSREITPVFIPKQSKQKYSTEFLDDEHLRLTSLEKLNSLKSISGEHGSITAGNASGINDGAAALLLASGEAVKKFNLTPKAKILGMATAGVLPRIMGMGPVPATIKVLEKLNLTLNDIDIIELNEAFAAQSLACLRALNLKDDDPRVNPLGGAIALGHPLGMSGARIVTSALYQMENSKAKKALCTMCIGVGQGISIVLEKI
ncbi:3-oxoadipyl-CoA thiolase [Sabulilitoribacter arenilitoris]|uniref:Beta-ketoadipyl-CoA thiolase n=1 Tax=Wocania arenilitoris TaxID=2044858 RepID=A0AAE3EKQ1_9FLAO|nr:3-oxoadipyl-CoA thiolase [Wocania arenilitoris]MCF7567073.1 3-oxoadipyl-CoA thiolase [Wocania arenilitoris]